MWQQFIVFIACLLGKLCLNFPLDNCRSNKLVLAIHVATVTPIQKVRLKSIVSMFLPEADDQFMNSRIAIFVSSNSTQPLIGFNSYTSSRDLLGKIENLNNYVERQFQVNEELLERAMQYFKEMEAGDDETSRVAIILCEYCREAYTNTIGINKKRIFMFNFMKIFTIWIKPYESVSVYTHLNDYALISSNDDLSENQLIALKLCGQCNADWFLFESEKKSHILKLSCYTLKLKESLISHDLSSALCRTLGGSHVVRIETFEEFDFIINTLVVLFVDKTSKNFNLSLRILNIILCKQFIKFIEFSNWRSKRPNIFDLSEIENAQGDSCFALEFRLNESNTNESWIQVSMDTDHANAVLCEFDVKTFNERVLANVQVDDKRNYTDIMKEFDYDKYRNLSFWDRPIRLTASYLCDTCPILAVFLRDGYTDCPDSSDEQIGGIEPDACAGMFICDIKIDYVKTGFEKYRSVVTKTCVEEEKICDGVYDCHDKMDENNCNVCMETSLSDGTCLPSQWFFKIKLIAESKPYRSEFFVNNDKIKRIEEMLALHEGTEYVHREDANIHVVRCVAGRYSSNSRSSFQHNNVSWAAKCIHLVQRYNRDKGIGCSDMSHLANCENFVCSNGLFKCPNSYCIPYYMMSDGRSDCPGGEEEFNFFKLELMQSQLMICRGYTRLVHPAHVCDGINNCPARDDELYCYEKCPTGFGCGYGVTQVFDHKKVNHGDLFQTIDKSTRILDLSGIALRAEYFKELHGEIQLFEIYLSNCSLSNEIVFEFISLYWHAMRYLTFIDLSYNDIVISTNSEIAENLKNLHLSHTQVKDFVLNVSYTRNWVVDFSFSDLNSLTIVGEEDVVLDFLNLSNTNLNTLWISKSHISINTLDIRDMHYLKYDSNTSKILKSLTVKSSVHGDSYKLCCSKFGCPDIQSVKCFAPEDPITSCDNLLGDFVKRTLSWLTGFIGTVFNVSVIVIQYVKNNDPSIFNRSTINIVLSDLIMSVYLLIIAGADVYYRDDYVLYDHEWRDSSLCKAAGFLATLSYTTSGVFVVLITAQLYNVHRHPTQERQSVGFSLVSLYVCVWCLCVVISLLPILIPAINIYSSNALCIGFPLPNKQQHGWMFAIFIHIIMSGVEIGLTVIGLILILRLIFFDSSCVESEINNTKTWFLIILSNVICGSIISITCLLTAVGINISPNRMGWLSLILLPLYSAITPLLCMWRIAQHKWVAYKART